MYRHEHRHQLSFEELFLPFGSKLFVDKSLIKLLELIPWDESADINVAELIVHGSNYNTTFSHLAGYINNQISFRARRE